jgi:flagellar FliL protein
MAEQSDDIEVVEEKKGGSKLLIIIIAVLLLAVIGLAAMMFLGGDDKEASPDAAPVETVKQKPVYHTFEKPFIVNFSHQSNEAVRYLQVKIKVMARDDSVIEAVKLHEPAIKHELLLLFFGQNYDELNTSEGTQALRDATLAQINEILANDNLSNELEAVYFTSLIMQ